MTVMRTGVSQIVIYTKRVDAMVAFYRLHFGFEPRIHGDEQITELRHSSHGFRILLHPISEEHIEGQNSVKLVFDVPDVELFCNLARQNGLNFGTIHEADGYLFVDAEDPSRNIISVSSRAYRGGR
ncbi:VOC family protein [Lentilitoribacter sp. EG35]|uniref:VOC family protein n=1 Tax=Lentilitoribacter sp. EG35 TaxID=3234192 RepID=UPI003460B528